MPRLQMLRHAPGDMPMEMDQRYVEESSSSPMSEGAGGGGGYADGDGCPNEGTEDSGADHSPASEPQEDEDGDGSCPMNED